MNSRRYVLDPLYGVLRPPEYVREALNHPELQRLRDVRLCNINSLSLTGAGTVNRYEHAIGTAYLAEQCISQWGPLPKDTKSDIILAAALHDIKSAPFGHSVQYVLETRGFKHEALEGLISPSGDETGGFVHWTSSADGMYMGLPPTLHHKFDLGRIGQLVAGRGRYGPLISGKGMDLDNIDNVYRMAYHMGIAQPGDVPVRLAKSLSVDANGLLIEPEAEPWVQHWYDTRKRVYEFLLLNPDEFSAKCMLQEAVEQATKDPQTDRQIWHASDSDLIQFLRSRQDPEVKKLVQRWMTGSLYGCLAIFSTDKTEFYDSLLKREARLQLEQELTDAAGGRGKADIGLHLIKDVNKTQRVVQLRTSHGSKIQVGKTTSRILIGIFLRNASTTMDKLNPESKTAMAMGKKVKSFLETKVGRPLTELPLFSEASP